MILIPELDAYLQQKKANLAAVNFVRCAVGKDEVINFLNIIKSTDNQIMLALIPDANTNKSQSEDNINLNNALSFLFLEKTDYSETSKYEEWLAVLSRTQVTALAFMKELINDKSEGSCGFNRFLDYKNISINPEVGLASCNGWSVDVYFDTPL